MSGEFKQDIPLWIEHIYEMGEEGSADIVIRREDDKELVFMFDNSSDGSRYQSLYYGTRKHNGKVQETEEVSGAFHFIEIISKFLKKEVD